MKSKTTGKFWEHYAALPSEMRKQAKSAYQLFQQDPWHPSLHFKRVHSTRPIYSVRISNNYRALGTYRDDYIIWFWIGTHAVYDTLLKQM